MQQIQNDWNALNDINENLKYFIDMQKQQNYSLQLQQVNKYFDVLNEYDF